MSPDGGFTVEEHCVPADATAAPAPTFGQLLARAVSAKEQSKQSSRAVSSVHRAWRRWWSASEDDPLPASAFDPPNISAFLDHAAAGWTANRRQQLNNYRSQLRFLERQLAELKGWGQGEDLTFRETLKLHVERCAEARGITVKAIIKTFKEVRSWLYSGTHPRQVSDERIDALERYLGAPPGTLKRYVTPKSKRARDWKKTAYAAKLNALTQCSYRIPAPAHIAAFLNGYFTYKTVDSPPLERTTKWTKNERGEIPRLGMVRGMTERFIGWLCLPATNPTQLKHVGRGMLPQDVNILDLYDAELITEYWQNFRKERSGGYTQTVQHELSNTREALRPKTGYVWQLSEMLIPHLCRKLGVRSVTTKQYRNWVEAQRARLIKFLKDIANEIEPGRPAFNDIMDILEMQHPVWWIEDLVRDMIRSLPPRADFRYPRAFQRIFILVFLAYAPLRELTMSVLRIEDVRWDGARARWVLKVDRKNFKNRRFLKVDSRSEYEVPFPTSVNWIFDRFFHEVRPKMDGAKAGSPHVIVWHRERSHNSRHPIDLKRPLGKNAIANEIRQETVIHRDRSLGLHWIRHAVATEYIKNREEGIVTVARLLNDKAETVAKHYSWVKNSDYIGFYVEYLETTLRHGWR